jgi:hypothetical protein
MDQRKSPGKNHGLLGIVVTILLVAKKNLQLMHLILMVFNLKSFIIVCPGKTSLVSRKKSRAIPGKKPLPAWASSAPVYSGLSADICYRQ